MHSLWDCRPKSTGPQVHILPHRPVSKPLKGGDIVKDTTQPSSETQALRRRSDRGRFREKTGIAQEESKKAPNGMATEKFTFVIFQSFSVCKVLHSLILTSEKHTEMSECV